MMCNQITFLNCFSVSLTKVFGDLSAPPAQISFQSEKGLLRHCPHLGIRLFVLVALDGADKSEFLDRSEDKPELNRVRVVRHSVSRRSRGQSPAVHDDSFDHHLLPRSYHPRHLPLLQVSKI